MTQPLRLWPRAVPDPLDLEPELDLQPPAPAEPAVVDDGVAADAVTAEVAPVAPAGIDEWVDELGDPQDEELAAPLDEAAADAAASLLAAAVAAPTTAATAPAAAEPSSADATSAPAPEPPSATPRPLRIVRPVSDPVPLPVPPRPRLAPASRDAVAPFRRRPFLPARRRRRTALLLLRRFLTAAMLVALPLVGVAWLLAVPQLRLRTISTDGARRVDPAWIDAALAPFRGQNLLLMPLGHLEAVLDAHPWIEGVELRKELPDRLWLRIHERVPVALLDQGGRVSYLDGRGQPIAPYDPARGPDGLLVVRAPAGLSPPFAGALGLAAELRRIEPAWGDGLTTVELLGDEDYRLESRALPFPLLVRAARVAGPAHVLARLLPELERRYPALAGVDLRFARRIVVEPVLPAPGSAVAAPPAATPAVASAPAPGAAVAPAATAPAATAPPGGVSVSSASVPVRRG